MIRRILIALVLLTAAAAVAWRLAVPAAPPRTGSAWMDELARGELVSHDLWVDAPALHHERASQDLSDAWRVPPTRWLVVDPEGWGGPEEWGSWGLGESTRLRFFLPAARPYDFLIRCASPPGSAASGRWQEVTLHLNGREVVSFQVTIETLEEDLVMQEHRFALPEEALRPGMNEIELRYAYHLDGISGRDDRPLALAFESVGLVDPDDERAKDDKRGPGYLVQPERETLVLAGSGSYVVPMTLGEGAVALELEIRGLKRFLSREERTLRAGILTLDGDREDLLSLGQADDQEAGQVYRVPLTAYRGSRVFFYLDAELAPGNRYVVRRPRLVTEAVEAPAEAVAAAPAAADRPPIVLIVLDAARADHFGLYGYSRDTTPVIDRLGRESLVFTQVVAECSYTLCSMPNLLLGLSFVQHGLIAKHLILAEGAETLAGRLAAAGYLTLGYTGNPNNSSAYGLERGYEEYYEIWEAHPGAITRQVGERLAQGTGGKPPFLMLHYVPPHEPYDPDPEFDLFGDPGYEGPVTSDRAITRAIYAKELLPDQEDVDEMVALYDGNLRMADAAVGEVLEALKEAGLYDDALIVVTSDHGEGFMEHGWVGHNTTIYDEMLEVPLVLKLPASWRALAEGVDTGRMASLADFVVTVDRRLGLTTPPEVVGKDLFAPQGEDERVLFLRSAHVLFPYFGVRTGRFKAMLQEGRLPELYDVQADPGETNDLIAEYPLLHAGLMALLSRAVDDEAALRAEEREGDFSEEQRKMLEALGYLGQ